MPTLRDSVIPHAAFLVVAALLSLQGCNDSVQAAPSTATTLVDSRPQVAATSRIDAGRYLVKIGGCNDCHSPGYMESIALKGVAPPESEWLLGADMGFAGPSGVSYPANLRLSFQNMTEEDFLKMSHEGAGRPPMPWPSLMSMSDEDLKAIYAYVRYLGPAGKAAPAPLSPGVAPDRPHILMNPVMPK